MSLCPVRGWPEAPINFIGHWITEARRRDSTARCSHHSKAQRCPLDPQRAGWGCGGHYQKCNHPSALFSALGVRGSVCPPPHFFLCEASFNQQTLPACDQVPSGLQNLSMLMLVIVRFLFLSFPNVLLFLCATSSKLGKANNKAAIFHRVYTSLLVLDRKDCLVSSLSLPHSLSSFL